MSTTNMTRHRLPTWKIAAATAALALAPALLASPAAADSDAPVRSGYTHIRHLHAHVRHGYAQVYGAEPAFIEPGWDAPYGYGYSVYGYNCGIGLYGTPLACEPGD
jgi:hypothetical protein